MIRIWLPNICCQKIHHGNYYILYKLHSEATSRKAWQPKIFMCRMYMINFYFYETLKHYTNISKRSFLKRNSFWNLEVEPFSIHYNIWLTQIEFLQVIELNWIIESLELSDAHVGRTKGIVPYRLPQKKNLTLSR